MSARTVRVGSRGGYGFAQAPETALPVPPLGEAEEPPPPSFSPTTWAFWSSSLLHPQDGFPYPSTTSSLFRVQR